MARELGPQGIHVAHVVIDGAIDTRFIAENFPERYALKEQHGILSPDAIAGNYWHLHRQEKSAWTHELDLRPWMESLVTANERTTVEYFFDVGSPTSYLAWTQLPKIAPRSALRSPGGRCCSAASSRRPATRAR
jgi:2-hydroxychromene-2-carboxylate isomerase